MRQPTVAVWVVGGTLLLAAAMAAAVAVAIVLPEAFAARLWAMNPEAAPWFAAHPTLGTLGVVSAGSVAAAAGVGLLRGNAWGWWAGVLIFAANGEGDVVRLISGDWVPGVTGLLIVCAFLTLLLRPGVRVYARVDGSRSHDEAAS